jgi:hypothetical protein
MTLASVLSLCVFNEWRSRHALHRVVVPGVDNLPVSAMNARLASTQRRSLESLDVTLMATIALAV